jgi:hypothetical protein
MSKINKNCNLGDVVRVVFDDHSEGEQHVVFEVFGRVLRKDRRSFVIACWKYADSDVDEEDRNMTVYTILRAAVRFIETLAPIETCQENLKGGTPSKSQRKRANSVASRQVMEKPESADTIPLDPPDSPESVTTTGVPSTKPTTS